MEQPQDLVARALGYPYAVPSHSFLLGRDGPGDVRELDPARSDGAGRTPLLAYGSNAAPDVLDRKLGESARRDPVPAVRAALHGFDVVYSAHVSRYGSIPAALRRSPGTEAAVFVLHLTEEQLELISATEPNYELSVLEEVTLALAGGETLTRIAAYMSRHGCLTIDGSEIALAAVEARGRRFPAMTQAEVLEHVRATIAPEQTLEQFVQTAAKRRRAIRASTP